MRISWRWECSQQMWPKPHQTEGNHNEADESSVSVWIICDGLETDILQSRFQCSSCHLADPLVYFSQLIQPPFVVPQMWQHPKMIILILSKAFELEIIMSQRRDRAGASVAHLFHCFFCLLLSYAQAYLLCSQLRLLRDIQMLLFPHPPTHPPTTHIRNPTFFL